jgi:hypothetical protein
VVAQLLPCNLCSPSVIQAKRPNFDVTHELDEFLMLEKPLTKQKRKENIDPEKMTPEMRELETKFNVYDFQSSTRMAYFPTEEERSSPSHTPQPSMQYASHAPRSVTQTQSSDRTRTSPSPSRSTSRGNGSYGGVSTAVHSQASLAPTDTYHGRSITGTPVPMPVDPRLQRVPPPLPPCVQVAYGYGNARPPRRA